MEKVTKTNRMEKKVTITIDEKVGIRTEVRGFNTFELLGLYRYLHRRIEYQMLISSKPVKKKSTTKQK